MEIFFIILVIGIIAVNVMRASSGINAKQAGQTSNEAEAYDIPASLKAKWTAEDKHKSTQRTKANISHVRPKPNQAAPRVVLGQAAKAWKESLQKENDESRRQSRRDDHRSNEQRKAMAKLGDGTPRDKNPHRRDDWGHRGHLNGGWITPIFISALCAAAVAALFATT